MTAGVGAVAANNTKKSAPGAVGYDNVDLQAQQRAAVQGNLANQADIEKLISQGNSFSQQQASALMEQAIPGYTKFAANLLQSGQSALDHPYDLPQDVQDNLTRISAEKGLSRGTRGQFNSFSAVKDLGVNMLDYGNNNFSRALSALTAVTGTAPRISPMSPLSFYVTPGQQAQNTTTNNQTNRAIAQGGANANAAANNFNNQNLWDSLTKSIGAINWGQVSNGANTYAKNANQAGAAAGAASATMNNPDPYT